MSRTIYGSIDCTTDSGIDLFSSARRLSRFHFSAFIQPVAQFFPLIRWDLILCDWLCIRWGRWRLIPLVFSAVIILPHHYSFDSFGASDLRSGWQAATGFPGTWQKLIQDLTEKQTIAPPNSAFVAVFGLNRYLDPSHCTQRKWELWTDKKPSRPFFLCYKMFVLFLPRLEKILLFLKF